MITIAACDDEAVFIDIISDEVREAMNKLNKKYTFSGFKSSVLFLSALESGELVPDVVFLDIVMPVMNGKQLALRIGDMYPDCSIIFITSHEDEVFEAFDYNVSGFISKFRLSERLEDNLFRVLKKKETTASPFADIVIYNESGGTEHIRVDIGKILYFECIMKKTYVHLSDGSEYRVKCGIWREVMHRFSDEPFAIPHQNYIVNMKHILRISASEIYLDGCSTPIPLSKHRKSDFTKACTSFSIRNGAIR